MYNTNYVYAFQNDTKLTNNLIIVNDGVSYQDSGIVIGNNTTSPNFRISYSTSDGISHIASSILSIDAPFCKMPFISSASTTGSYNYLVMDGSGNLVVGQKQYANDINQILNTIQNNIASINTELVSLESSMQQIDPNQIIAKISFSRKWVIVLMVLVALLIFAVIYLFIQWFRTNALFTMLVARLERTERDLGEFSPLPPSTSILKPIAPIIPPTIPLVDSTLPVLPIHSPSIPSTLDSLFNTKPSDIELNETDYML